MNFDDYIGKENRIFDQHFYEPSIHCKFLAIVDYNWSPSEQQHLESIAELMD